MKRLALILTCACATLPKAPPAPVTDLTVDGDVTSAHLGGMQVLVKRTPGAELASIQLTIQGGVRNWTEESAGVEAVALAVAVHGGTDNADKDEFARRLDAAGAELSTQTMLGASRIEAKTMKAGFDVTFGALADAFMMPVLPEAEFELQRMQSLFALQMEQLVPDARLQLLERDALFSKMGWGHPEGTYRSLTAMNEADVARHLAKLREASRLLLVVVGDVDPAHVLDLARGAFGRLPAGHYANTNLGAPHFDQASLNAVEADLPTNYILAGFVGPAPREPDFPIGQVAMHLLQNRVFEEVRTKRHLSYAPAAYFQDAGGISIGALYVTATDPNPTMKVMLDEARKLRDQTVDARELQGIEAMSVTGIFMSTDSTSGQAALLSEAQLAYGDWHIARQLPEWMRAVTPAQVQAFAKKYLAHLQTVVIGDPRKIDGALFQSL